MAVAQQDPAPGNPSKKEKQKKGADLRSSEIEENPLLIMQEGLSESSQLVPVFELAIRNARRQNLLAGIARHK